MPRASHRLALIALLTMGAFSARAENLQDLYQAGLAYDASYLSARASLDAAQYRLDQVYALRRPSVGLQIGSSYNVSRTPGVASQESANNTQVGATVSGTQSLFNRANDKTITQAEKALEVARADFSSAEQDLIIRISQAYFDVLAAKDTLGTARSSLAAISEQVASAKRNFEVGTATITDTNEAQARYDQIVAQEIATVNDIEIKRRAVGQTSRVAFWGVLSGESQVKALEAAEASSKLALEATQLGYKVGVRVNLDVLNAQTQLFQTQRDLAKARYDVLVGSLKLRQAAGELKADDIDPVNAMLAK